MKNMTNKEIYFYLQDICENNYNKYSLEEDYYVHKFKPFEEKLMGRKYMVIIRKNFLT